MTVLLYWTCKSCQQLNFADKQVCEKCGGQPSQRQKKTQVIDKYHPMKEFGL